MRLRSTITVATVLVCWWARPAIGDDKYKHRGDAGKTPGELKQILDREKYSLPDMIKAAEKKTGGRAAAACVKEWRLLQDSTVSLASTGEFTQDQLKNMDPSHPVATVVCVTADRITEVIVCGNTGKVIATRDSDRYQHEHGSFSSSAGPRGGRGELGWNQAPARWQRLTDLQSKPVHKTGTGEKIGDIKDFAIDPDAARVIYQIVQFDNKMGHGNRYYAVPFSAATLSQDYKSIEMSYSTAQVNQANGFDPNNWPNLVEDRFATTVFKAFGDDPYWKSSGQLSGGRVVPASERRVGGRVSFRAPNRWLKANDLVGAKIRNPRTNEDLGSLKDIAVDPDTGRILYGVLASGGFLGMGKDFFAIPWGAFEIVGDGKTINLDVAKDRLKEAEGFDKDHWPDMADMRWAANIHNYYGRPRYWENDDDRDDATDRD